MNITVVGSGYVGLVTGACFSEFGVQVTCTDLIAERIEALNRCEIPIYEPGLEDLVRRNLEAKRLSFTIDTDESIRNALVVFIAVGTPPGDDGSTDLKYVEAGARQIGRNMDGYKVVVTKSTVPVGTSLKVKGWIEEELAEKGLSVDFSVVSNPEFLREGSAIGDFMRPDRVVIGSEDNDSQSMAIMKDLYRPLFLNETPFVLTDLATSELSKYAGNAFLATKISFINELAILCDKVGGDVQSVARAIGLDQRIGKKFLHAGPGYGGSCFPKDTLSIAHFAKSVGLDFSIIEAVLEVNKRQREYALEKVVSACGGNVEGSTVAMLGLSFKPETDDIRESAAIDIARELVSRGATLRAYDPEAMEAASMELSSLVLCQDPYEAARGADVLAIVTEWNEFRALDLNRIGEMLKQRKIVDMRNVYIPDLVRGQGFEYWSIGRP
ncbi:UDP-glucose/GDP-mannose dehydrogenase family protein [Myxococcota bacterium]|nr:UDP-glucose/GDP-mannose dehydrogenase family protein [Myxococcota bacterium]